MKIEISNELKEICIAIVETDWNEPTWAEHESDDWFQSNSYVGGYDADEKAFCFSFYDKDGVEYWFQFSLLEARKIAKDENVNLLGRLAE